MGKREWVILAAVFLVSGCGKWTPPAQRAQVSADTPSGETVSTFMLVGHTDDGRKKWEVRGQTANLLSETVHLSPVEATSYGNTKLDLTADRGQYHRDTRNIHLEQNVVLITADGVRLKTDSFDWDAQRQTGTTSAWVTVLRPGMRVVGQGGVCFPKVKRVRLEKSVTVTLLGNGGQTVVTCDGPMEVDYGRHKIRFWRDVLVKDLKGTIRSDRLDVALNEKTNAMERATFWGHVRMNQGPQSAVANRANYWQLQGRTRLIGHPRLAMLSNGEKWRE